MGGDGGTIISRRDCMRFNKGRKENNVSKDMRRMTKWLNCSLSQEPLRKPIAACRLGRLYNKDRLIEFLLDRHSKTSNNTDDDLSSSNMSHVKSLKDVKELAVCENIQRDHVNKEDRKSSQQARSMYPFVCPIMGMEMNGVYKFAFPFSCGCLLAERAIRSLQISVCPNCNKEFDPSDVIVVHAEGDDLELMKSRLESKALEQEARKREKEREKSRKKKLASEGSLGGSVMTADTLCKDGSIAEENEGPSMRKKIKTTEESVSGSSSTDVCTSNNTGATDTGANPKRPLPKSTSVSSSSKDKETPKLNLNTDEMKASQSFKSLFHKHTGSDRTLDPNRGFWSQTTHSYFFKGT